MIGKSISHYRIVEKLDHGGMGVVWKAEDLKLGRPAALKFLPSSLCDDEEAKERFIHEAKAASALDHPNICTIYEIGETAEGQLFIAMAFYEGETLQKKIGRGPLSVAEAIDYARQTAAGLAKSHERDIIHRDIKPANIFITAEGQVKILDFGLAKILSEGAATVTGLAQGTPAYMAPERIRNEKANPRTDLWSLGVVLFEALTGERPFKGENVAEIIQAVHKDEPPKIPLLRPGIPPRLSGIVRRLLRKKPRGRYSSCWELLRDLAELDGAIAAEVGRLGTDTVNLRGFPPPRRRWRFFQAGALIPALFFLIFVLALFWVVSKASRDETSGQKRVAILFFENRSGDPELDWMQHGIPAILSRDLAQSSHLQVLHTEEVDQALRDLAGTDDTAETVRQLALVVRADLVLTGNVINARDTNIGNAETPRTDPGEAGSGDARRLVVELREAPSGSSLFSMTVDVPTEGDLLFLRVEDLSHGLRQRLEQLDTAETDPDREAREPATSFALGRIADEPI